MKRLFCYRWWKTENIGILIIFGYFFIFVVGRFIILFLGLVYGSEGRINCYWIRLVKRLVRYRRMVKMGIVRW